MIDVDYVAIEPVEQMIGTNPDTGIPQYYKVDADGVVVEMYSGTIWLTIKDNLGPFGTPNDLAPAVSEADEVEVVDTLVETEKIKPLTQYILVGDEPPGSHAISLKTSLDEENIKNLKILMTRMPRPMLFQWFMDKIYPKLPAMFTTNSFGTNASDYDSAGNYINPFYGLKYRKKAYQDAVWAAVIDLFNEANLEYVNKQGVAPWDWENEKLNAYYTAKNQKNADAAIADVDSYKNIDLALDPKANALMERYLALPRIGDVGLEINRQSAVRELLRRKNYGAVDAILQAFEYADATIIGPEIAKPIPVDIVAGDGTTVKATAL